MYDTAETTLETLTHYHRRSTTLSIAGKQYIYDTGVCVKNAHLMKM